MALRVVIDYGLILLAQSVTRGLMFTVNQTEVVDSSVKMNIKIRGSNQNTDTNTKWTSEQGLSCLGVPTVTSAPSQPLSQRRPSWSLSFQGLELHDIGSGGHELNVAN